MDSVTALNKEYFESYGPGGYEKNYKYYGFSLPNLLFSLTRHHLYPISVLDVGCAFGYTVRDLRRAGIKAYGIEIADYAVEKFPEPMKPYLKQMDARDISKFKPNSFSCVFCNCLMYLTRNEILKWLSDVHVIAESSLFVVNPFKDYPETLPRDVERTFVETRQWWLDTVPKFGFEYCKGTNMLFRKI